MSHDQVESVQVFVPRATLGIQTLGRPPRTCLLFLSSRKEAGKDVDHVVSMLLWELTEKAREDPFSLQKHSRICFGSGSMPWKFVSPILNAVFIMSQITLY